MSKANEIIEDVLFELGVASEAVAAPAESVVKVLRKLNGLVAALQDDNIDCGAVYCPEPGSELSEPLGTRNAFVAMVAVESAGLFPNSSLEDSTIQAARRGYKRLQDRWENLEIPSPQARSTYPKGAGHTLRRFYRINEEVKD